MTNQVRTILLLGLLSAVLVAFSGMLGPGYLYFSTGLAVLVNLGAYFFSDRIVLAMRKAREVAREDAPRLHAGWSSSRHLRGHAAGRRGWGGA